jgi:hypothetical protein
MPILSFNQVWKVFGIGLIVGAILGFLIIQIFNSRYEVTTGGNVNVIKVDKWTGKSWKLLRLGAPEGEAGISSFAWMPIEER